MKKHRKAQAAAANQPASPGNEASSNSSPFSGWKLWFFRIVAIMGVPAVLFVLLELGLRLVGSGYSTAFTLPASRDGLKVFVQNNQFGWRFFGPELARLPYPFSISQSKARDTIRIFVLGESAAKGDPDPHFGLPRVLEAMLRFRHPGVRFEVVNTAMTAINSHAILPIARDCAQAGGDVWVIYMGNNEVVGPFGAGTVFGPQSPPLPLIRGAMALKSTRTGQLLDSILQRMRKSPTEKSEWGGMEMFLDQQVRADDPRMKGVYHHFERNLADIIRTAQRSGVGVVVSTVAVNLKDCAPFASAHRVGFSAADKARWDELHQLGIKAQDAGDPRQAAERFAEAAKLDETFAELRFRQGQCALALGKILEAQQHFQAARDLDTLRFRCDTRLDALTRKSASGQESRKVLLADAQRSFAERSAQGLPGEEFFYEHVHLTFEGNCLLARIIGEQAEKLLTERLTANSGAVQPWPSSAECAARLGWSDWFRAAGWKGVLPRLNNPPFTGQFDHPVRMQRVQAALATLASATQAGGISHALRVCEAALTAAPADWALYAELASLKKASGDLRAAAAAARREVELLPSDAEGWSQLGSILTRQRQFTEAAVAFQHALQMDSRDVVSRENLAQSLAALGRNEEAIQEFRRVLALRPGLSPAWLHLAQTLEQLGRKAEAEASYEKALMNRSQNSAVLVELASFCQSRGWFEKAAENYEAALMLDPANAKLQVGAGQNLAALGRLAEASRHSAEAVRLAPDFAEAHLLHGMVLGRQGLIAAASEQFREALRLKPDLLDARLNLGVAMLEQKPAEALGHFEAVLRQSPTNSTALKYVQQLRAKLATEPFC